MSPGGAGRGLTCHSAATGMAGRGPTWPLNCGRWLPVRLPKVSLAMLMFECSAETVGAGERGLGDGGVEDAPGLSDELGLGDALGLGLELGPVTARFLPGPA